MDITYVRRNGEIYVIGNSNDQELLEKIRDSYSCEYLITLPNHQWVATVKATSLFEARRKAEKIKKERCLFSYNLWVLTGDQK